MIDRATRRARLVKQTGSIVNRGNVEETTVTGMIVPIDGDLRSELVRVGGRIEDLPFDLDYVLEIGRTPGDLATWSVTAIGSAIALLALFVTWQRRYVVFRAGGTASAGQPGDGQIDLRASGRFTLDGKKQKRFLGMPAALTYSRDGLPVLVSHVDASSRFMGIKTGDRAGAWIIALPGDAAAAIEHGHQYAGMGRRPGLRIHHADAKGKATATVLSCGDERQCAAVVAALANPPAPSAEPTAGA